MELDQPNFEFKPPADRRPTMPEPPPVRLGAVEDVNLPTSSKQAALLDAFYVTLLKFEREPGEAIVYKAENAKLRFTVVPDEELREDMRSISIDVPSLRDLELLLVEREYPFVKERGLFLGQTNFMLRDPAGNWIRLGAIQRIL